MKRRGFLQGVAAAIACLSAAASGFGAAVSNVCSKLAPVKRRVILPPLPKWNGLTDDIDGLDYRKRSEDFERSLLPKDLVFPGEGQVWEVVHDCEVSGRNLREKGILFWGNVKLKKGEQVRILPLDHPKPLRISFQRLAPDQANHLLWVRTARTVPGQREEAAAYFNELFKLVSG